MNYKFSSLLGAPYRGGNLLIHDNELLTPVGNRVTQVRWRAQGHASTTPIRACTRRIGAAARSSAAAPAAPVCRRLSAHC
jgi:hypothetical protein